MKDHGVRVLFAAHFRREGDVVDVWARLKEAGQVRPGFERCVGLIALEDDTVVGTGDVNFIFGKRRVKTSRNCSSLMADLSHLFFPGVANKREVPRADADPLVFGRDRLVRRRYRQQYEKRDQKGGESFCDHSRVNR